MLTPKPTRPAAALVSLAAALVAGAAGASTPSVTERIEPTTIAIGESARLTISQSGGGTSSIAPPMIAGLEFLAVDQSQRIESVNGVSHSQTSVTYQVIPQHPGIYTIQDPEPGSTPLELTVTGNGSGGAGGNGGASPAPTGGNAFPPGAAHATADGSAFVRLRLPTHQLYVGERIPVDIQVGTRDGMVASLNGAPTLNGDAFTLEPLSTDPERTTEMMNGRPYTVFTWHSALEAVKPGVLSLTMETPLTVRVRRPMPRDAFFADSGFEDLLNDPTLQNFFGNETQKEVTVASAPATFTVLALPSAGRPADFSGAVGRFTVWSDLSDEKAVAGDPLTLRLHIAGSGNFDRVAARMLQNPDHWTTYAPKATFKPADQVGYRGEKTFEQPVIARDSGTESLPALDFSWFDPDKRRYEHAYTAPLRVAVTPAPNGASSLAQIAAPSPSGNSAAMNTVISPTPGGLRPDHVVTGSGPASLVPYSHRPAFLAIPSLMMLAFSGAFFWVGRRRHDGSDDGKPTALQTYRSLLADAAASNDPELFFRAARAALQEALGAAWQVPPNQITLEAVENRLGTQGTAAQVFRLADEAAYFKDAMPPCNFGRWHALIDRQLTEVVS